MEETTKMHFTYFNITIAMAIVHAFVLHPTLIALHSLPAAVLSLAIAVAIAAFVLHAFFGLQRSMRQLAGAPAAAVAERAECEAKDRVEFDRAMSEAIREVTMTHAQDAMDYGMAAYTLGYDLGPTGAVELKVARISLDQVYLPAEEQPNCLRKDETVISEEEMQRKRARLWEKLKEDLSPKRQGHGGARKRAMSRRAAVVA